MEMMLLSIVKDMSLAQSGVDKINWVKNFMPVLNAIDDEYGKSKPFANLNVTICLHLEAKTAYMAQVFHHAGANVSTVILFATISSFSCSMTVKIICSPSDAAL